MENLPAVEARSSLRRRPQRNNPMRNLTDREKRTVRLAGLAISVYLVLFFGLQFWKRMEAKRADYQQLLTNAQRLRREILPYENRVLLAQKLKENFRMEPQKLAKATLVAQASAAIQNAAKDGTIQLGPLRESSGRASAKELTSIQLEGSGPVPAVLTFLHQLETLGYPLLVDALQMAPDPTKPGQIKVTMTIVILDFDQWKDSEVPRA